MQRRGNLGGGERPGDNIGNAGGDKRAGVQIVGRNRCDKYRKSRRDPVQPSGEIEHHCRGRQMTDDQGIETIR